MTPNRPRASRRTFAPLGVLALGLTASCGDTVDLLDAVARPQGSSPSPQSTDASTDGGADTRADSGAVSETSDEPATEAGSTTGGEVTRCGQLDLLFVVDDTELDAPVLEALLQRAGDLEALLRDPSRPWASDFHVGVVPTQDTGPSSECRVSGALSIQPRNAGEPCPTASGQPWASTEDAEGMLECLSALEITTEQDRRVAEASGRGLGSPVPGDANGNEVAATCNAGFHRLDAVTVLVLITAGDDLGSPGDAATWSEAVTAGVNAPELVIAMLPESQAGEGCGGPAVRLMEWLYYEANATVVDWCAPTPTDAVDDLIAELEQRLDSHCAM